MAKPVVSFCNRLVKRTGSCWSVTRAPRGGRASGGGPKSRALAVPGGGGFRKGGPRLPLASQRLQNLPPPQPRPAISHGHLNLLALRIFRLDRHIDQRLPVLGQVAER